MTSPSTPIVSTSSFKVNRSRRSSTPARKRERVSDSPVPKTPKGISTFRAKSVSNNVLNPPTPTQFPSQSLTLNQVEPFLKSEFEILPKILDVITALNTELNNLTPIEPSEIVKTANTLATHLSNIRTKISNLPGGHLSLQDQKEAIIRLGNIQRKRQDQLTAYSNMVQNDMTKMELD